MERVPYEMKLFGTVTHRVVRQPRVIRIRSPVYGQECLDGVNERILMGAKGEIDEVEGDHRLNSRFRGPCVF